MTKRDIRYATIKMGEVPAWYRAIIFALMTAAALMAFLLGWILNG
jgi:hypothetical protein